MMSSIVDGKVLDWHFKKHPNGYVFYIGDILIGQLFNLGRISRWSAVSNRPIRGHGDGFISRWKASEFLLKLNEFQ